jgi:hypothetical protein
VVTSITNPSNQFQTFLLPNPANQQVLISVQRPDQLSETQVRVMDMRGVEVFRRSIKPEEDANLQYPVSQLAKGVYLIEIVHGTQRMVKRLIVN